MVDSQYEVIDNCTILPDDFPKHDLSFKIIVIGNSGVGKSCLSIKATKNIFENNYLATVGFEFFPFNVKVEDKVIKLQIWDTCGQEIYRSLITNFYRNSSLGLIVYSIEDEKSFEDVDVWIKDLKANSSPDIKVFLIGNKADLEQTRKITASQGEQLKEDYGMNLFIETSAKTGVNAKKLFVEAAKLLYQDYVLYSKESTEDIKDQKKENFTMNSETVKKAAKEKEKEKEKKKCC